MEGERAVGNNGEAEAEDWRVSYATQRKGPTNQPRVDETEQRTGDGSNVAMDLDLVAESTADPTTMEDPKPSITSMENQAELSTMVEHNAITESNPLLSATATSIQTPIEPKEHTGLYEGKLSDAPAAVAGSEIGDGLMQLETPMAITKDMASHLPATTRNLKATVADPGRIRANPEIIQLHPIAPNLELVFNEMNLEALLGDQLSRVGYLISSIIVRSIFLTIETFVLIFEFATVRGEVYHRYMIHDSFSESNSGVMTWDIIREHYILNLFVVGCLLLYVIVVLHLVCLGLVWLGFGDVVILFLYALQ